MTGEKQQRRGVRTKAVLPVRIKGKDISGKAFDDVAHTLDVAAQGARLGSIRHELNVFDEITVFFRQRKMQFRVVWIKKMHGTSEFHIGLQAVMQDKEVGGVGAPVRQDAVVPLEVSPASGIA